MLTCLRWGVLLLGLIIAFNSPLLMANDQSTCFSVANATGVDLKYQFDTNDANMTTADHGDDEDTVLRLYPISFCTDGREQSGNADTLVRLENYKHRSQQIGMHLSITRNHDSDGHFNGTFSVAAVDWSDDEPVEQCWFEGHEQGDTVQVEQGEQISLQCRWKQR